MAKKDPIQPTVSFAIGIPTINQWPLLKSFLPIYTMDFPETRIYILDNGRQNIDVTGFPNVIVIHQKKNIGVAASWNYLCREIFKDHTHAAILNDDVLWRPNDSMRPLSGFISRSQRDFYKTQLDNWCVFILPKKTFEKIGEFNTLFYPAYFEDRDYMRRMKLAGCSIMQNICFNPIVYYESLSTKKDNSLLDNFDRNEQLYIEMWGGLPGQEKFDRPFDGKLKN
jgi:GT2 family glycosyltransferase